jgi:glycosyltransferase involved in cell wall biosynthesis
VWNQRDEGRGRLSGRLWRNFEARAVRQTPRFISNSHHGAFFLRETLGVAPGKIAVIHNGVQLAPPQKTREEWRRDLGVGDECLLACMVANVHYYKDHPTLLRAWRIVVDTLQQEGCEAVLLLAGRLDDAGDEVKALAFDLDLRGSVRFLGGVNDVPGLLRAVDFSVFSSRLEGVPNGVLESMASGLAVAATDIPGIREALGAGGNDMLAPPRDAEALADRILRLARDPGLRHDLGVANLHRVRTLYDPDRMCETTTSVISEALQTPVA